MEKDAKRHKERSKAHFEKISSHYSDTYAAKYTGPMHDALIKELERRNFATLLDVGCGTGTFLSMILNKFNARVFGIDISPGMIKKSRELLSDRADLKVGDSEHLPWSDESFDIVTCIASFHHYPHPEPVLKEMKRVLRHGGSLIIADPWAPNPWRFFANLIIRSPFNKGGEVRVYSLEEMREFLERCGFASIGWRTKGRLGRAFFVVTAQRN
jgi:ubiquinone/menaquinone biosynthesis C-methylase UbiE